MPRRGVIDVAQLAAEVRQGLPRAVARAISVVERGDPQRDELLSALSRGRSEDHSRSDQQSPIATRVIGITGPPGAGKSTLLNRLIAVARRRGRPVAVLAVDPSSPYSGGALLGDRVRMAKHSGDTGVYIRSMASRGHHGGLAAAALETVTILESAGYKDIFVESVGVGQSEVGILTIADLVAIVLNPGAGDDIQALKAGVLEIGDLYVINKADHPGVERLRRDLLEVCANATHTAIEPRVVSTVAVEDSGTEELYDAIEERYDALCENGELTTRRSARVGAALIEIATERFRTWITKKKFLTVGTDIHFADVRRRLDELIAAIDREYGGHDG